MQVAQIVWWADRAGDSHGTHTAATVAGSVEGFNASTDVPLLATGIAPGARLVLWDTGLPDSGILVPFDPSPMIESMAQAGAIISSHSWGTEDWGYGGMSYRYDAYTWAEQDKLLVFAAGNSGTAVHAAFSVGNVGSPGNCKNVLTVGATEVSKAWSCITCAAA